MSKKKYHPHPDLDQIVPQFRQDLFDWREAMGLTEGEA